MLTAAAAWADGDGAAGAGEAIGLAAPCGENGADAFAWGAGVLDVPTTVGGGPPGVGAGNGNAAAPETGLACGLAAAAGETAGEAPATGETAGLTAGDADGLCGADGVVAPWGPLVGVVFAIFGAHADKVRPRPT